MSRTTVQISITVRHDEMISPDYIKELLLMKIKNDRWVEEHIHSIYGKVFHYEA